MLLSDEQIAALGIVTPFKPDPVFFAGTKTGACDYGVDLTLANEFKAVRPSDEPLSPENFGEADVDVVFAEEFILPPGGFVLAKTVETLNLPPNVCAEFTDISTWARCGLSLQNTTARAGWGGQLVLELFNQQCRPLRLRAGQGIVHARFTMGSPRSRVADGGRYQGQRGVTLPRRAAP